MITLTHPTIEDGYLLAAIVAVVTCAWKYRVVVETGAKSIRWIAFVNGRAARIEENMAILTKAVSDVREIVARELSPNGGASIKDVLMDTRNMAYIAAARANSLSNHSKFGMYECDPSGRCTFANAALCDLFGMDSSAMLDHGWLSAIVDEERAASADAWEKSVREHLPYSWTYHIRNARTKEIILCSTSAQPVIAGGKIIAFTGSVKAV